MHILSGGRNTYLNFLRNLPSQSFILSFAVFSGYKLEPKFFYWENTQDTINFIIFLALSIAAIYANFTTFVEEYLSEYNGKSSKILRRLIKKDVKGWKRLKAVIRFSWKNQPKVFSEAIIVGIVVQYGVVAVLIAAVFSAINLFKLAH